ncbi:MAG TPA: M1 family aminopeptidase [Candidatus Angelobacter sp.]|nr:M1 family aminopeptidase [Candidatus Angelobacter sp.]
MRTLAILLAAAAPLVAQAPEGIPRDLARQRAQQLQDVRYRLSYSISPKAPFIAGHEELRFVQNAYARGILPELLDFREGEVKSLTINGQAAPATIQNGHIELPAKLLRLGENVVDIDFTAPVAPAGKAFTRFEDKDDGSEYIYTLFVPMDAEMAFPCFDQPDLKAKFRLEVTAPLEWAVISNTTGVETFEANAGGGGIHRLEFPETKPISTYLFAFAAGPFKKVHDVPGMPGLYVRQSKLQKAEAEAPEVQQITADGIKYLSKYFAQPFPFPKYDMVMIPGFAYGGMEHAGATFLREESILFRAAPTHSDHLNRDILLLHELTHQWFGDLVTMRWFDDLWLKEGFAQYMAYHALADLKPNENVWKRFYQAIKPAAYAIDSTQGTTPIYQEITNLKDAKSAYGAIVYSKAPGVLKQLAFVLGEDGFRDGLRLYLKEHAYANAEWSDLVGAFERVSKKSLSEWASAYIKRRGMPQLDVEWTCAEPSGVSHVTLTQHNVLPEAGTWPVATQVLFHYRMTESVLRVEWQGTKTNFGDATKGQGCPQWIFANDADYAYGRFLLDPGSRKAVMASLGGIHDVFERTLLWGSLWDSVREAELDPSEYIELALKLLPNERDEALAQSIIGRMTTALHRYESPEVRGRLVPKAEALAYDQMLHSKEADMRIIWFRALRGVAETDKARARIKDLLSGKLVVPGVELRPLDRWNMITGLVALNDPEADALLAAEEKRDPSGDGRKYAYMAAAARPDAATKKLYFDAYLHDASRPEDWVEQSLGLFNYWNQEQLTLPYLSRALEALPQVKSQRKIFFVLGWLNAFIGGQQSPQAQAEVQKFLAGATLDKDLKLKILEVSDELDRTVRIREKYASGKPEHGL